MFYSDCTGGIWVEGDEHLFNPRQEPDTMLRQTQLLSIFPSNIHLDYCTKQINMGKQRANTLWYHSSHPLVITHTSRTCWISRRRLFNMPLSIQNRRKIIRSRIKLCVFSTSIPSVIVNSAARVCVSAQRFAQRSSLYIDSVMRFLVPLIASFFIFFPPHCKHRETHTHTQICV